ncbi:MAG: c-type cytochrome [Rubellimicrobium sp.]|nr:c-type cytochrome [Rubellimicrobium sp.]
MIRALPLLALAGILLAACVESGQPDGRSLFADNCASCHGADARGAGPAAAGLPVAPPDLTGIAARNGGTFPRDRVMSTIDGYSRGQHGAQVMPEFGAGDLGPTVIVEDGAGNGIPVPADLLALADYIAALQAP